MIETALDDAVKRMRVDLEGVARRRATASS